MRETCEFSQNKSRKVATFPKIFLSQNFIITMYIKIQIADSVYQQLVSGNKRIQGTLALSNPTEGNFNAHKKTWQHKPGMRYLKLPHGRVTVCDENVRMNLHIKREECLVPARTIEAESNMASSFIDFMEEWV